MFGTFYFAQAYFAEGAFTLALGIDKKLPGTTTTLYIAAT